MLHVEFSEAKYSETLIYIVPLYIEFLDIRSFSILFEIAYQSSVILTFIMQ